MPRETVDDVLMEIKWVVDMGLVEIEGFYDPLGASIPRESSPAKENAVEVGRVIRESTLRATRTPDLRLNQNAH